MRFGGYHPAHSRFQAVSSEMHLTEEGIMNSSIKCRREVKYWNALAILFRDVTLIHSLPLPLKKEI